MTEVRQSFPNKITVVVGLTSSNKHNDAKKYMLLYKLFFKTPNGFLK